MDAVRIQIIRGCDSNGQGGTVVDDASGVLADGVLDQVAAAFQAHDGLYSYQSNGETVTVTALRNISVRLRQFAEGVTEWFGNKTIDEAAATQKQALKQQLEASRTIVEN